MPRLRIGLQCIKEVAHDSLVNSQRLKHDTHLITGACVFNHTKYLTAVELKMSQTLIDRAECGLINQIVHQACKSIQLRSLRARTTRQKPRGPGKRFCVRIHDGLRICTEISHAASNREATEPNIKRSTTLAEVTTPGTPAPGCVPAPTKYKLLSCAERFG